MREFVCVKPITLSGRNFSYGDIIPDGYVLPERALALIRSNYITSFESETPVSEAVTPIRPFQGETGETLITIPISTENGILEVITSSQTVTTVFSIMQKTVEEAEKDIAGLEDENALILLNAADSRKGIQKAAEERATQLNKGPEDNAGNGEVQEKGGA